MPKYFLNLPACPTIAEAEAEMRRRESKRAAGFECIDGFRLCAEIPEHVATALIDEASRRVVSDAAKLAEIAASWYGKSNY